MTLSELRSLIESIVSEQMNELDPTQQEDADDLDESDKDHEGDPRWDDHADPTGKSWNTGLE